MEYLFHHYIQTLLNRATTLKLDVLPQWKKETPILQNLRENNLVLVFLHKIFLLQKMVDLHDYIILENVASHLLIMNSP